ncbi:hypothetical protein ACK3YQ_07660 [Aeromonas caviae]
MEDHRLLASAALFRQLHENKKDIYDVLTQFIRASISWSASWSFNVTECSSSLEHYFGFKIPDAVIKSCLKNRLKRTGEISQQQGIYSTTESFIRADLLREEYSAVKSEQEFIIEELINHVEITKAKKLVQPERLKLLNDFHNYFLGGLKPCENSLLISEFIVKKSISKEFTEKLNRVEEGLILYGGICHSSILANHEPWRSHFTVFLDTEVLFFSQGYNGSLYKNIFNDFHSLITELNSRTSKDTRIELRYFDETKREVEDFFYAAEKIVELRKEPDPSKPAMINITNGCKNANDVLAKKAIFYDNLRKLRIQEEMPLDYYEPSSYVVEGKQLLLQLKDEYPDLDHEKTPDILRLFTKINFLRRGVSNRGLEQSSAILASGKYITRTLAFSKIIQQEPKNVPFATDVDYLTERLWLKLNKGFGDSKLPVTFDVVARAQIILSTQAGHKVAEDYKELLNQVKSGKLSQNSAGHLVSELRSRTTKPEDFGPENVEEMSTYLRSEFIEDALRQKALLQLKAEEGEQHKIQVDHLSDMLKKQSHIAKEQEVAYKKQLEKQNLQLRQRDVALYKERLKPLRRKAEIEFKALISVTYTIVFLCCTIIALIVKSEADTNLGIIGFIISTTPLTLTLIKNKSLSNFISKVIVARYRQRQRKESSFSTKVQSLKSPLSE